MINKKRSFYESFSIVFSYFFVRNFHSWLTKAAQGIITRPSYTHLLQFNISSVIYVTFWPRESFPLPLQSVVILFLYRVRKINIHNFYYPRNCDKLSNQGCEIFLSREGVLLEFLVNIEIASIWVASSKKKFC